jgi:cytochrome c nitrite reductase small subunit
VAAALIAVVIGVAAGLGGYTFVYARGYSYLTNDPVACANCHVMQDYYSGWVKSSHRSVATCNDCHTPPDPLGKYATKASNGFWHSFYFTTGGFHEPIQIGHRNRAIAEASCRRCHADLVAAMDRPHGLSDGPSCVRCHGPVGHPRQ